MMTVRLRAAGCARTASPSRSRAESCSFTGPPPSPTPQLDRRALRWNPSSGLVPRPPSPQGRRKYFTVRPAARQNRVRLPLPRCRPRRNTIDALCGGTPHPASYLSHLLPKGEGGISGAASYLGHLLPTGEGSISRAASYLSHLLLKGEGSDVYFTRRKNVETPGQRLRPQARGDAAPSPTSTFCRTTSHF